MASEDLFVEEFSEEIVPVNEVVNNDIEIPQDNTEENLIEDGTEEDEAIVVETAAAAAAANDENSEKSASATRENKLCQLPTSRIKNLMKLDPDFHLASHEAVFLVTRATELFIQSLARESYTYTAQAKKKTVQKRDVDLAIAAVDSLMFLDGAMNF